MAPTQTSTPTPAPVAEESVASDASNDEWWLNTATVASSAEETNQIETELGDSLIKSM